MTRSDSSKPTNPWPSFERLTLRDLVDSISIGKSRSSDDADEAMAQSRRVPEIASGTGIAFSGGSAKPRWSWLGHASVLMQVPSSGNRNEPFNILFDPIASQRCSPISFLGPKRRTPFPCSIQSIGNINLVILSHDHHDHCDAATIRQIEACSGSSTTYAVPTGMDRTLRKIGIPDSRILPMQWWEEVAISHDGRVVQRRQLGEPASETMTLSGDKDKLDGDIGTELMVLPAISFEPSRDTSNQDQVGDIQLVEVSEVEVKMSYDVEKESLKDLATLDDASTPLFTGEGEIKITCLPSQHKSLFRLWGNRSSWSSWLVQSRSDTKISTCYFGGDTGYRSRPDGPTCPVFPQIHERYGSPDISFLPISVGAVLPYIEKVTHGWVRVSSTAARRFHATPDDAVSMLGVLGGRAYGIHWGTWSTDKGASRTVKDLEAAKTASPEAGVNFHLSKIGEWIHIE